jgi:dolichol-phosphate mannosyltransferase
MLCAIILPTYNETETLPIFLKEILPYLSGGEIIVVSDDSQRESRNAIRKLISEYNNVFLLEGEVKGGRGKAVRRALDFILNNFPEISHIIEADCDGSHRVKDVLELKEFDEKSDFVIGSRYVSSSKIIGWSTSRRVLSRFLNWIIPKILEIDTSDITNGLRRYSRRSSEILMSQKARSDGFIYLSEQALFLKVEGIHPEHIAIRFESRIAGKSSVGPIDLFRSLVGVVQIFLVSRELRVSKE